MLRRIAYSRGFPRVSLMRGQAPRSFGISRRFCSDDIHDNVGDPGGKVWDLSSRVQVFENEIVNVKQITNDLSSRAKVFEKEIVDVKQTTNDTRADLKLGLQDVNHKMEMGFQKLDTKIDSKFDTLHRLMKDMAADQQKQFAQFAADQQKGFTQFVADQQKGFTQFVADQQQGFAQFYMRGFFGIIALSMLLVGSAWILPQLETNRLESEIKRRVIVKHGVDEMRRSA